jgi:hypothetical protein
MAARQQQQQRLLVPEIPGTLHQPEQQQQQELEQQELEDQLGPLIGGVLGGPTRSLKRLDSDSFKKMIPEHWGAPAGQEDAFDDVVNQLKQE